MDQSTSSASSVPSHQRLGAKTAAATQPTEIDGVYQPCEGLESDPYRELRVRLDQKERVFWCWFAPRGRASSFSIALLEEFSMLQKAIRQRAVSNVPEDAGFDYMVLGSSCETAFNLGSDFALIHQLVHDRNRDGLRRYAELCVDVVRANAQSYDKSIVTIANVTGSCLSTGFEVALSCDVIIAEEDVQFGFPELRFGLFPGMGAINFLSRRLGWRQTEQFLLRGRTYSAKDLYNIGLVDRVVARGQGEAATRRFIKQHNTGIRASVESSGAMRYAHPFNNTEFDRIITLWVETAMRLSKRDLSQMLKVAERQNTSAH